MAPILYRSEEFLHNSFCYVIYVRARGVSVAKKAHQNTHFCVTHNKQRSSHPFTAAVAKKVSASLRVVCAVKMSVLIDFKNFAGQTMYLGTGTW